MPDDREIVYHLADQWRRWAQADLTVASLIDDERIAPAIVAFHAQQAAEKILKALLVLRQIEFPHTHSIGALLALCEKAGYSGVEKMNEAVVLTRYAVASRYPSEEEAVTRAEAKEAADMADQVFSWGLAFLQKAEGNE